LGALRSGGAVNERSLAGMLSGLLFLTGATSGATILVLPGATLTHWRSVLVLAAVSGAWGLACLLVVPWRTAAGWVTHASTSAGLLLTASAIAATGGVQSPTRFYLFFAVVLAGAFYRPGAALAYLLACGAVHALPLLYDPQAVGAGFLRELLVVVPAYLVLGGALVWGKRMLVSLRVQAETSEAEHRRLAAEQGALSRVATAVAAGEGPQEVYRLISEEAARLMGASASGLLRVQSAREMVVVGSWSLLATASMSLPSAFRAGRGPGLAAGRAERMAPRSHSAAAGGGADPRRGQDRCPRCRASEDRTAHRR